MANASFHAKITADARQFIQQVEQANQALQELTKATQESQSGRSGRAGKSAEAQKRKEQKVTHKEAEQALDDLHQEEMQNIKRENIARLAATKQQKDAIKKARQADRLEGPVREDQDPGVQQGFKDQAKLITGAQRLTAETKQQADIQKQVAQQKNKLAAQTKKQVLDEQKRVALQQKLVQEGKLAFGPLREQESTTEGLLQSQRERNRLLKEERAAAQAIAKAQKANVSLVGPENLAASQEQKILRQKKLQADVDKQIVKEKQRITAENKKTIVLEKKLNDSKKRALGPIQQGVAGTRQLNTLADQYNETLREQKANATAIASQNRAQSEAMITGRYALYDMANAYRGVLDVASRVTKELVMTIQKAADFETAFTSVERAATLEKGSEEFNEIREALIDLSREIPVAFDEISEIATLGAQMGIVTDDLTQFTETVAQFSAVTGNSIDDTAEKFGRLSSLANVPTDEFENLASAVVFAGFNAVATEKEILKMSESIVAAAANSGFAGDQVVGLATALSSLAVPPERARGAIQELFSEMNRSVQGTSENITNFANIMGLTETAAKELFESDPEAFFSEFLSGLGSVDNLTVKLDEFGFVNRRTVDVIQRLVENMDVYEKSIRETSEAYAEGTELANVYEKTQDNLNSKLQRLANAFDAFQAAAAGPFAAALAGILDPVIELVGWFTKLAENPVGSFLLGTITVLAAGTAAFAGMNFVLNIATAQLLAMRTAMAKMGQMQSMNILGATGFISTLKALKSQIDGTTVAVTMKTGALEFLNKEQMEAAVLAGTLTKKNQQLALSNAQAATATRGLSVALRLLPWVGIASGIALAGTAVLGMGGAFDSSAKKAEEEAKRLREVGQAGVAAAGGLEAFTNALEQDAESARVKTLGDLEDSQIKVNDALQLGIDLYEEYRDSVPEGEDADLDIAKDNGKRYRELIFEGLKEPIGDQELSFFEYQRDLSDTDKKVIKELGLDINKIYEAELKKAGGGVSLVERQLSFMDSIDDAIVNFKIKYDATPLDEEFDVDAALKGIEAEFGPAFSEIISNLFADAKTNEDFYRMFDELSNLDFSQYQDAAGYIQGINTEIQDGIEAEKEYQKSLKGASDELDDNSDSTDDNAKSQKTLNDNVKDYLKLVGKEEAANQDNAQAYAELALGLQDTEEGIDGVGKASSDNLDNLQDFLDSAFAAGFAEDDTVIGGLERVSAGIFALGEQGEDTSDIWDRTRGLFGASLSEMGGAYAKLGLRLAVEPDFSAAAKIVAGFLASAEASEDASEDVITNLGAIYSAMTTGGDFAESYETAISDALSRISTSSRTAKTALEKLEEQLEKTFNWFNRQAGVNDAIRSLGTGLQENTAVFSIWSERGQENVQNILDVIDALADQSQGDVKSFANSLMSLRTVLSNMGVGENGLRHIDRALDDLGVTGVASTKEMQRFNTVLNNTGEEAVTAAEAIDAFASSVKSGLEARFAEARALDEITLAMLDYEDAQEEASEAIQDFTDDIADANEEITDARQAIEEANAAIKELEAQRGTLEYQLEVALRYGDLLRAEAIRAEIEGIDTDISGEENNISDANQDIADSQDDIAEAEQGIIDVRTESTRETIEATRALEDLAVKYADATAFMLINAEEGADLNDIIDKQVTAFEENAKQMGYTEDEASSMADVLKDELIASMEDIPENIETEISAEIDTALADIDYFVDEANKRLSDLEKDIVITQTVANAIPAGLYSGGFGYTALANGGLVSGYSNGGLISGPGGPRSDSIPAMLSDGEYVIQANAVDKYGLPFMNALNQSMVRANPVMSGGGGSGNGSGVMQLSPEDRALLRAAMERPISLYTDNATIAKSANDGNSLLAQRGLN